MCYPCDRGIVLPICPGSLPDVTLTSESTSYIQTNLEPLQLRLSTTFTSRTRPCAFSPLAP